MLYKLIIKILYFFPKKIAHRILYRITMKRGLDLNNPITLNEKIHWLELYYYGKQEAKLTDKNLVKSYIKNKKIKDLNVSKTYFVIDNLNKDSYNIEKFPNKFVLKCNHGSGDVFICNDKSKFNFDKALKTLYKVKKQKFSKAFLEYHYKYIKPVIMCEEYLNDNINKCPYDYKFFCYNGYVPVVLVCADRDTDNTRDFFDSNWNHLDFVNSNKKSKNKGIIKPKNINRMFEIASELSKGYPFVRIDLYNINEKIYFGEMTFTPAAGLSKYYTRECDKFLGSFIDINKLKSDKRGI